MEPRYPPAIEKQPDVAGPPSPDPEEVEALITDDRGRLTPAQMVERKLVALLKANPVPVSNVTAGARLLRPR
jgi:hypothetical protein